MKKILIFLVFLLAVSCGKNYDKMTSVELEQEIDTEIEKYEKKILVGDYKVSEAYKIEREIEVKRDLFFLKKQVESGKIEKPKKLRVILKNDNEISKIDDIDEIKDLQKRIDSKLWYTGKLTDKEYRMSEALNFRMSELLSDLSIKKFQKMQKSKKK